MVDPRPVAEGGTLNYPALTIEAKKRQAGAREVDQRPGGRERRLPAAPLRRRPDAALGQPAGGPGGTDTHGMDGMPYTGPVPIVTHVHGAHTTEDSDGYPEAWYLPAADGHPGRLRHRRLASTSSSSRRPRPAQGQTWEPGSAVFQYPNDQRPHDAVVPRPHARHDAPQRLRRPGRLLPAAQDGDKVAAKLPRPAPPRGDKPGTKYHEIPIAIQDRSFNADGSLFYPDNRAFFEGLNVPGRSQQFPGAPELRIPFTPDTALDGQMSDISPQWNPEFFGNTMVVNGKTWPYLNVEQRRYRFRLLNGTPVAVPHPQDEQRHALHADRQRGRLPARAGQAAAAADRAGGARRRDRRLQQGQARDADHPAQPRAGRAVRRRRGRRGVRAGRPGHHRPGDAVPRRQGHLARHQREARRPASCRRSSGCRRPAWSATSASTSSTRPRSRRPRTTDGNVVLDPTASRSARRRPRSARG